MELINRNSPLWLYLADEIKGLISDGEILLDKAAFVKDEISDFSYLVFPFSKAYEGFLKKLFLDLKLIHEDEYYGDDIRIGRILNPRFVHERTSVYNKICLHSHVKHEPELSERLWDVWRRGRNRVFHYFPHNFRKLSYKESSEIINDVVRVMELTVVKCDLTRLF